MGAFNDGNCEWNIVVILSIGFVESLPRGDEAAGTRRSSSGYLSGCLCLLTLHQLLQRDFRCLFLGFWLLFEEFAKLHSLSEIYLINFDYERPYKAVGFDF